LSLTHPNLSPVLPPSLPLERLRGVEKANPSLSDECMGWLMQQALDIVMPSSRHFDRFWDRIQSELTSTAYRKGNPHSEAYPAG
jgi:hypothetical protein